MSLDPGNFKINGQFSGESERLLRDHVNLVVTKYVEAKNYLYLFAVWSSFASIFDMSQYSCEKKMGSLNRKRNIFADKIRK